MSRRRIVMVGTDPSGQGGVAAVLSVYIEQGLFERWGVCFLASHRAGSALARSLLFLRCAFQLLGLLVAGRVALLHVQSASYGSFWRKSLLLALARAFGVPTVFHLHGAEFQKFQARSAPWVQRWIRHTLERSTRVLALSEAWREALVRLAPQARVEVLANPVRYPAQAGHASEQSGRLLFMGRAETRKGVFDLLTALRLARQQHPLLHLRIGGDGDLDAVRAAIEREGLQQAVTLLGWVRGADKERELAEAEVFVLPSHDEGLPMALLECMARGKAIVSTPVGGIPQALRDGQDGLLVPPGQPEALAQALRSLHGDALLRRRLGDSARERVREHYATDTVLARLEALYRELGLEPLR
ncbi:MAG: glycosyltransferase family 4 protein [Burkholderiales bacterium]|nr:glycosyltransferase family 4 protein [Burkholderiales bacterium]